MKSCFELVQVMQHKIWLANEKIPFFFSSYTMHQTVEINCSHCWYVPHFFFKKKALHINVEMQRLRKFTLRKTKQNRKLVCFVMAPQRWIIQFCTTLTATYVSTYFSSVPSQFAISGKIAWVPFLIKFSNLIQLFHNLTQYYNWCSF